MFKLLKMLYLHIKNSKKANISVLSNVSFKSEFSGSNVVCKKSFFDGQIGYGSYIGENCRIYGKIGSFCSIAGNVTVIVGRHPASTFVSTHPCFFSLLRQNGETFVTSQKFTENRYADDENKFPVVIGNDVWIGYGASIISGVKIGDGAIIAAGSVVTKDVEPYSIVGGVPAKVIRRRFDDDDIDFLLNFRWWDKPIDWIKENADSFDNIKTFIARNKE